MKKVTILKMVVVLTIIIMMSGCAIKRACLFNQPICPSNLSPVQRRMMQTREIECQKIETEGFFLQQHRREYSSTGIHILTLRH